MESEMVFLYFYFKTYKIKHWSQNDKKQQYAEIKIQFLSGDIRICENLY
jgi:hypothetical protein